LCCLCVCLWLYLLNGAISRTKILPRVIQDESSFPYVLATSYHQKQFPFSRRPLLYTACKWWPRMAEHPKSLLCCAWWVRIDAINCSVSVMGKAMKQGWKQEQAALQIVSPQLTVSSDQKAMAVWWSVCALMWKGLQALVQPLARGICWVQNGYNWCAWRQIQQPLFPAFRYFLCIWMKTYCWKWAGGSWHWYETGRSVVSKLVNSFLPHCKQS